MNDHHHRREALIAAALASELSTAEQQELDALCEDDPSIREEVQTLSALTARIRTSAPEWIEGEPPARLREAVLEIPDVTATDADATGMADGAATSSPFATAATPRRRGARPLIMAAAVVAAFAAGVAVVLGVQGILDAPPDGPPGTYGAVEPVSFTATPEGVDVDGSLIAHTWGTETVLEIAGLPPGEAFTLVLISEEGEEFHSGTFFGSEVLIECRMNAAVMRDEVERLEITSAEGEAVFSAHLPDAIDPEEASAR